MSRSPRWREALTALGLAAGPVVALGFTRFAYALLLPAMRDDLHWTYAQAGGLNTANAAGYVIGAGTAVFWARRFGDRAAFVGTLAVGALALLLTATTADYSVLNLLRFVGGLATAVAFVLGSALAARVATGDGQRRGALLVGIYMAGVGIGVALSGLLVPAALTMAGDAGWRSGWLLLGIVAVLAVGPAVFAVRRVAPVTGVTRAGLPRADLARLAPTFGWYVLFGAGYVSYLTFVIALLRDRGLGTPGVAAFFVVLGLASAVATLTVWGAGGRPAGGRPGTGAGLPAGAARRAAGAAAAGRAARGDGVGRGLRQLLHGRSDGGHGARPPGPARERLDRRHRPADGGLLGGPGGRPAAVGPARRLRRGGGRALAVGGAARRGRAGRVASARPRPGCRAGIGEPALAAGR
ncbi:YbfB/YjiJ family MFS transporter [Micromonospora sp. 4G55]|nr:YbfB/YjiJ family MFS transporter [Micromonospora sp. 4G55]MBM0259264.1 YbfB/YjiJ family MFS transporter [Micromonospora sp. 4G55]